MDIHLSGDSYRRTGSYSEILTHCHWYVCTYVLHCTAAVMVYKGSSLVLRIHSGGRVVHSAGRIIPHQFLITSKHKISYLRGTLPKQTTVYRITCTVSSGPPPPRFYSPNGTLDTIGVTQHQNAHSVGLEVDKANITTLQNRDMFCGDNDTNYFHLYLTSSDNRVNTMPCTFIYSVYSKPVRQRAL